MGNAAHLPCGSWNMSPGIAEELPVEQPARMLGPYKDRKESQGQKHTSGGTETLESRQPDEIAVTSMESAVNQPPSGKLERTWRRG